MKKTSAFIKFEIPENKLFLLGNKMNVRREFQPRLFEILEITPRLMTKAALGKELHKWLVKNHYMRGNIIYINDDKINELCDLELHTEYTWLPDNWWPFVTLVYQKFKITN